LVTDVLGKPVDTLVKGPETEIESVVGKYSTLLTKKMFKADVSLRKVMATIFWDILDIVTDFVACSATVTAVPIRQCYSALRKHCNVRGLVYLSYVYCCCTIMPGVILRAPSLLCWTSGIGNVFPIYHTVHINSLGLFKTGQAFPRLVISIL
jgi:hypothetical protein